MAIAIRTGEETRQVQMVCLDELVAGDDVLRRVERLVDRGSWCGGRPRRSIRISGGRVSIRWCW